MKKCSQCKKEKDFSEFYLNRSAKDGYQWECIKCVRERQVSKEYLEYEKLVKNCAEGFKVCTKCRVEMPISQFTKKTAKPDGLNNQCKSCEKEYREANKEKAAAYKKEHYRKNISIYKKRAKKYREENKEYKAQQDKEYRENNKEAVKEYRKQYREKNREKLNERDRLYRKNNKEKIAEGKKDYRKRNREKLNAADREYQKNNRDKVNKRLKEKKAADPLYKLTCSLRIMLNNSFKRGGYSKTTQSYKVLGAEFNDVLLYLNNNPYGFNYGDDNIDIDHIIPLNTAETKEDLYRLNHYTNLQLLPSYYNRYIKFNNSFDKEDFERWLETEYNK